MPRRKNSLKDILNKASELYNIDQYSSTSKNLTKSQIKTIKRELKEIAANKKNRIIKLTKFLKPLVIPTAKRVTLKSKIELSKIKFDKNIVVYMPNHKSHLDEF
ncbi:MAG: hypothetical protein HQ521_08970, partial [Bacteroidetes bacterium]|nr:hypothetical protein [Bacteroidota bacterium]